MSDPKYKSSAHSEVERDAKGASANNTRANVNVASMELIAFVLVLVVLNALIAISHAPMPIVQMSPYEQGRFAADVVWAVTVPQLPLMGLASLVKWLRNSRTMAQIYILISAIVIVVDIFSFAAK